MKNHVIGVVVASIAVYLWGFLYWGANPLPYQTWGTSTDSAALGEALEQYLPDSGVYYVPDVTLPEAERERLHEAGPIAFIYYHNHGAPVMDSTLMGMGFAHGVASVALLALLLNVLRSSWSSVAQGVKISLLVGCSAAVIINLGDAIWWRQAWDWQVHRAIYYVVFYAIAGAVLCKLAPKRA